ncbi:hypothetical protein DOTSEDRAFT_73868 [Dothistroma septosporum NZE10]|uniref:Uncharacterized protein n=1 Tax=Dothistroma septosporum (strain NZE10 / CBS 128990) TaxID=675120 RepID=N1PJ62_DOTSN|nr:hypothetical protein DOTSEDRAFT_73868 [Dothistroma septosporum NZE10]
MMSHGGWGATCIFQALEECHCHIAMGVQHASPNWYAASKTHDSTFFDEDMLSFLDNIAQKGTTSVWLPDLSLPSTKGALLTRNTISKIPLVDVPAHN